MTLNIISAEEILFQGNVSSVTLPGTLGSFTVLKNHAALVSTLTAGEITYVAEGETEPASRAIEGGIADVDNNVVSVCLY